jgi:hypothetical protein
MDEPEEPTGELRFMDVCHFHGANAARQLSEATGLLHRGGLAFLEYSDEAEQHWTLIVNGEDYRAQVSPFLDVDGQTRLEQVGDFDWKPDQILRTLYGWLADWKQRKQAPADDDEPPDRMA